MKWGLAFLGSGLVVLALLAFLQGKGASGKLAELFQRSWKIERLFYRHHRLTGTLLFIGAAVFLALLSMTDQSVHPSLHAFWQTPRGLFIARIVKWLAWSLACSSLLIGLAVILRPSLLKPLEHYANLQVIEVKPGLPRHVSIAGALFFAGVIALWASMSL